jgi:isocitrate/isopropylmalate dehydrogenase
VLKLPFTSTEIISNGVVCWYFADPSFGRHPSALMAEAAHGTAPALEGKDVANPMAMILAGAALLSHADDETCQAAGRAIREACLEAVAEGVRTADLSGHHGTRAFTDEVIRRTKTKLDVWASL